VDINQFKGGLLPRNPRRTVALINLVLLGLTSSVLIGYSIFDGEAHFFPLVIIAVWCLYIQFLVRKKKLARERWIAKQQSQEVAMAVFSILVMSSLLIGPVLKFIAILT
jgi:Ca2+/Na+ antiporter